MNLDHALENEFMSVSEKQADKQFRPSDEIYHVSSIEKEAEAWCNYQVILF